MQLTQTRTRQRLIFTNGYRIRERPFPCISRMRMKGGGHGQSNINFLEENGIEYNIVKEYDNGVRVGNVPKHKTPSKRTGTGQAWFPKNWSDSKIKEAGNYVTNLPDNKNLPDGVIGYGEYDGVRVGIIKTDGKIGTIFLDADLQP